VRLTGRTRLVGLIGDPVAHSASPAMHNAAFAAQGLDWCYVPLPVSGEGLGAALRGLPALGFVGINVTVPHKLAVLSYLDELSPLAERIGAVNTVRFEQGRVLGDNTDAPGFVADLRAAGRDPKATRALVFGAGGAARAVVAGLADAGCGSIKVWARRPAATAALCASLASTGAAQALPQRELVTAFSQASLVVNATPIGLPGFVEDGAPWERLAFRADQLVMDLIYAPEPTALLARARREGAEVRDGLGMLAEQGAAAWSWWTGQAAPIEVMRAALKEGSCSND